MSSDGLIICQTCLRQDAHDVQVTTSELRRGTTTITSSSCLSGSSSSAPLAVEKKCSMSTLLRVRITTTPSRMFSHWWRCRMPQAWEPRAWEPQAWEEALPQGLLTIGACTRQPMINTSWLRPLLTAKKHCQPGLLGTPVSPSNLHDHAPCCQNSCFSLFSLIGNNDIAAPKGANSCHGW